MEGTYPKCSGYEWFIIKAVQEQPARVGDHTVLLQRALKGLIGALRMISIFPKRRIQPAGIGSPISLLNVEGKIFFGVIGRGMTNFRVDNGYIDTSGQATSILGLSGCLDHAGYLSHMTSSKFQERISIQSSCTSLLSTTTSTNQALEVAIMMDCVSLLIIMLREAKDIAKREMLDRGKCYHRRKHSWTMLRF